MRKRKVCVISGARADYGLMYWVLKGIEESEELELQIIATGMHLSPEFGLTYRTIEGDGFRIDKKVEILLSSDSPIGISKAIGLGVIGFSEAFSELKPDLVLIPVDRFELLAAATAALVARIPMAQMHAGETTEGAIDEAIRHSITKMSHVHFTTTETYRKRVIQLGENPDHVFNFGAPGIDTIKRLQFLERSELEDKINFNLKPRNLLVTFHPTTLETNTASDQFFQLLLALERIDDVGFIFSKTNADTDGRIINEMIDSFVRRNPTRSTAHHSLGQLRYLSTLRLMHGVIGNSSSGLIEAPSLGIGTINIGDRQKGRVRAESVIDCEPEERSLSTALELIFSDGFRHKLKTVVNPHGEGGASEKIVEKLCTVRLGKIVKKRFFDQPC